MTIRDITAWLAQLVKRLNPDEIRFTCDASRTTSDGYCRSGVLAVVVEALMNNAGWKGTLQQPRN